MVEMENAYAGMKENPNPLHNILLLKLLLILTNSSCCDCFQQWLRHCNPNDKGRSKTDEKAV